MSLLCFLAAPCTGSGSPYATLHYVVWCVGVCSAVRCGACGAVFRFARCARCGVSWRSRSAHRAHHARCARCVRCGVSWHPFFLHLREGCKVLWWVYLPVCSSVCLHNWKTARPDFTGFCAYCLWAWLSPPLMALCHEFAVVTVQVRFSLLKFTILLLLN